MIETYPRDFYARDAASVARALVGATLCFHRPADGRMLTARVVETEAYVGAHDLACHAAKGRTRRTEVMFGPPGHAYVYLVYGMYDMLNVVTGPDGEPQAVLIRAAEPLGGVDVALRGPGVLTRELGITRALNGVDVCAGPLTLGPGAAPLAVEATPRIGVAYAGEWATAPLRFFDGRSACVSGRRVRRGAVAG